MKTFENMREVAESDGYVSVGIVAVDQEGCTHTAYNAENKATLIGALERLKYRILENDEPE